MIKKRIEEVDLLRGTAIILMVLGHSIITYPIDISNLSWCVNLHNIIYSFHMELLFFVAGVVYKCVKYKDFCKKKLKRIGIPYVFFGLTNMLLHTTGSKAINTAKVVTFKEGLYKFFFAGGSYWFLYTMLIMFLVYPFIEKVVDSTVKKILLIIVLIVSQCIIKFPGVLTISNIAYYFPYFIAGQLVNEHYISSAAENEFKKNVGNQIEVFLFSSIMFTVLMCFVPTNNIASITLLMKYVKAILLIIASYIICLWIKDGVIKSVLIESSIFSLQMYLFNGFIMAPIRIVLCNICIISNSLIIVLGIWIPDVLITLLVCNIIKKNRFIKLICGM